MGFEFDGDKYRQASGHQKKMGRALIAELSLRGSESILDFGCGDGTLTEELAQLVPNGRVVGIDASEGMIHVAQQLQGENLTFRQLDINRVDFEGEFDVVFSNATLHWIKDHRKLLVNIYRSLRPNGVVHYNFAGNGNCANLITVLEEVMDEERFVGYFSDFEWPWYMPGVDDYERLVGQCKFSMKRVWGETTDAYFANSEEMIGWIDQPCLVPFLIRIDAEDKGEFRHAVIEKMIERTMQTDGRCFETGRRINVRARK